MEIKVGDIVKLDRAAELGKGPFKVVHIDPNPRNDFPYNVEESNGQRWWVAWHWIYPINNE